MVRTFIGLTLDDETRAALAAQIQALRRRLPEIRWVEADNLHLTLKFIGNVPTPDLPEIFRAVDQAAAAHAPFLLDIATLGCFPDLRRPRIVWAGSEAGADACIALAQSLEDVFADLGYERERKTFTPHVTIGRVRHPRQADGLEPALEAQQDTDYGSVDVQHVTVFMSELKKNGAEYTVMHRAQLAG